MCGSGGWNFAATIVNLRTNSLAHCRCIDISSLYNTARTSGTLVCINQGATQSTICCGHNRSQPRGRNDRNAHIRYESIANINRSSHRACWLGWEKLGHNPTVWLGWKVSRESNSIAQSAPIVSPFIHRLMDSMPSTMRRIRIAYEINSDPPRVMNHHSQTFRLAVRIVDAHSDRINKLECNFSPTRHIRVVNCHRYIPSGCARYIIISGLAVRHL